jgi:hypothetical protein
VPAKAKLTDEQVKRIARRVRAGERQTDLADEFDVNRKTLRRRLDARERAQTERAQQLAAKRLQRQAARERRTLRERERAARLAARNRENTASASQPGQRPAPQTVSPRDPYHVWLDTPKNLSGRALAEAQGRVRVRNPEGTIHTWRERSEIDALLEAGWQLA